MIAFARQAVDYDRALVGDVIAVRIAQPDYSPGAAQRKSQRRSGTTKRLVSSELPRLDDSPKITAIHTSGGSQSAGRIACYDTRMAKVDWSYHRKG